MQLHPAAPVLWGGRGLKLHPGFDGKEDIHAAPVLWGGRGLKETNKQTGAWSLFVVM